MRIIQLFYLNIMEKNRSKIHEMLKKVSTSHIKHYHVSPTENSQISSINSPKRSYQTTPLKSSLKHLNSHITRIVTSTNKGQKHILNKTSYVTPGQKSALMSYISTPNENSLSTSISSQITGKLKKVKQNKRMTQYKTRDVFPSTEDQNLSEQSVTVDFCFSKKKIFSKQYMCFQTMKILKQDFIQILHKCREVQQFYGMIGLDQVPYNHGLRKILNDPMETFETLLNKKIHSISIQPIVVPKKPCYDHLDLTDFKILQYLGSGGFSNVYLAKCEIDQRICALKFIKKDSITSAKKAKMLQNQKQILFTINSPHLVDLYYAFETLNYIVFGLEYCPNNNLYTFIKNKSGLAENEARYIFCEILNGLQYLHQNNILFRDIKLENILFDEHGKIKITDFGLSKPQLGEDQITYSYCGSPQYMAPQMLAKCGHSFQVDYYALGILLYELLFGISPFYAPRKEDIFLAIMNSEPKFPKDTQVSQEVKDLIKGLLAKNPAYRIGSLKGVKQIRSHPWIKNGVCTKSKIFDFPLENIKISSKQMKQLSQKFESDFMQKDCRKYFFPKSFVNKQLVSQLEKNIVVFEKKKIGCIEKNKQKMVKSSSAHKFKKNK